ncbi:MAG: hypothetical protein Q7T80_17230 [Methanoregula sp.]|nr:hypothetical protein [Methanoregula sp.]
MAVILVLVMVAVLLVAGCAEQSEVTPEITENNRLQTGNGTFWIKIDPISSREMGDRFSITGDTNLPAGEEVVCEISSPPAEYTLKNARAAPTVIHVTGGADGLNHTLLYIDSAKLVPDDYLQGSRDDTIRLSLVERAVRGDARDELPIVLEKKPYNISLDPVADKHVGDIFTVTGTTSLPAGDELEVVVSSLINGSSMIRGNVTIRNGSNGVNTTSFNVDASGFPRVEYDRYLVSENYHSERISVTGSTGFKTSTHPSSPYFIRITPCPAFQHIDPYDILHPVDSTCTFRGTTNLSAGDDVSWEIRPIPVAGMAALSERAIINGTTKVTKGEAGLNQTSFTVNSSVFLGCGGFLITEDGQLKDGHGYDLLFIVPIVKPD